MEWDFPDDMKFWSMYCKCQGPYFQTPSHQKSDSRKILKSRLAFWAAKKETTMFETAISWGYVWHDLPFEASVQFLLDILI